MIERFPFLYPGFDGGEPKELALLSITSQSFFQPFSLKDNLLVILTALTSGSGIGFNRAMLFRLEDERLSGEAWLGPRSAEEARLIWEVLSTPGIGYVEIIEHNRALLTGETADSLTGRIKPLAYSLRADPLMIPALAATGCDNILVRDARHEPLVDPSFLALIDVDEFVCIPLCSGNDVLGILVLDNAYTRNPIEPKDVRLADLVGVLAANNIQAALLHRKMVEMEKMAALGEMSSFIAHQLRNPLAVIGGFSDQLLKGTADETKTRRNIEIIRRETRRLEDVLSKITRFLKSDIRQPEPVDLKPEIEAVLASDEIRRKADGLVLSYDLDPTPPLVLADLTTAGEALRNLVVNALEATPAGGRVAVRSLPRPPGEFIVAVEDTGAGLTSEARTRLFQPFHTTKDKGLGLGLLFVHRVMQAAGGRVEVESEPGRGTTFRLVFRTPGNNEGRQPS